MFTHTRRALAISAAATILTAPAAHAQVIEQFTEPLTFSGHGDCDNGFAIDMNEVGEQTVVVKQRGKNLFQFVTVRGGSTATYVADDGAGRHVEWHWVNRFQYKDQRIISVQGNLTTLLIGVTQHFDVHDPSDRRDSGFDRRVEWQITIDTTTGDVVDETDWTKNVGHYSIAGSACLDAARFSTM